MELYQLRVKDELENLLTLLTKLEAFFERNDFKTLDSTNQSLLKTQALAMRVYASCLEARILRFN
jgi:hypothetical protein